jgi:hypothetical protein
MTFKRFPDIIFIDCRRRYHHHPRPLPLTLDGRSFGAPGRRTGQNDPKDDRHMRGRGTLLVLPCWDKSRGHLKHQFVRCSTPLFFGSSQPTSGEYGSRVIVGLLKRQRQDRRNGRARRAPPLNRQKMTFPVSLVASWRFCERKQMTLDENKAGARGRCWAASDTGQFVGSPVCAHLFHTISIGQ